MLGGGGGAAGLRSLSRIESPQPGRAKTLRHSNRFRIGFILQPAGQRVTLRLRLDPFRLDPACHFCGPDRFHLGRSNGPADLLHRGPVAVAIAPDHRPSHRGEEHSKPDKAKLRVHFGAAASGRAFHFAWAAASLV